MSVTEENIRLMPDARPYVARLDVDTVALKNAAKLLGYTPQQIADLCIILDTPNPIFNAVTYETDEPAGVADYMQFIDGSYSIYMYPSRIAEEIEHGKEPVRLQNWPRRLSLPNSIINHALAEKMYLKGEYATIRSIIGTDPARVEGHKAAAQYRAVNFANSDHAASIFKRIIDIELQDPS